MNLIDGKKLAKEIRRKVKKKIARLGVTPGLAVILAGKDPASHLYVRLKEKACREVGIHFEKFLFAVDTKCRRETSTRNKLEKRLLDLIDTLNQRSDMHGILVQLPLPKHLNTNKIIAAISPEKDVDGFHPENTKLLLKNQPRVIPPAVKAIIKLIEKTKISPQGKKAVLLARSQVFAEPIKYLLEQKGVKVKVMNKKEIQPGVLKKADMVVSALGRPGFIKAEMLKPGAVVIDVGFARLNNKVSGDVDSKSVKSLIGWLTPVPGGVGPMTVACLLENVLILAKKAQKMPKNFGTSIDKNFKIVDVSGKMFDCYRYQDKKYLLLIFYRGYWCNFCRAQLDELNKNYNKFKNLGIKIAALSADSALHTSLLITFLKSKFPLLSDKEYKIFKKFGLEKPKKIKKINPSIFLLSPEHKIVYSFLGKNPKDRPGAPDLLKTCQKIIN